MRLLLALLVIVYLVGIGVVLSPTIQAKWNSGTASELVAGVWAELPRAMSWPVTLYHDLADERRKEAA
jgi:hypothetical protein